MYLISIYFDKQTNKTLQWYIDKIAEKTGNRHQYWIVIKIGLQNPRVSFVYVQRTIFDCHKLFSFRVVEWIVFVLFVQELLA